MGLTLNGPFRKVVSLESHYIIRDIIIMALKGTSLGIQIKQSIQGSGRSVEVVRGVLLVMAYTACMFMYIYGYIYT